VGKNSDFQQIMHCFLKTLQDRCIVSVKGDWEVICALSNGGIADDLD